MTTTLRSPEQRVVLHHISWDIYESLLIAHRQRSVPRFTYDRGELEIVSPSAEHEQLTRIRNRLGVCLGIVNCHFYFEVAGIAAAESLGQVESFGVRMTHSKPPEQCKPEFCGFLARGRACARACKQPLTSICQDDHLGIAVVAPILGAKPFNADDVTNFQGVSVPAGPDEQIRTPHFHTPVRYIAVFILDVYVKPGVRILPLDLCNGTR